MSNSDFDTALSQQVQIRLPCGSDIIRSCNEAIIGNKKDLKVNCYCNLQKGIEKIREILTEEQLKIFSSTIFGKFLDIGDLPWVNGQLLILLIVNHVKQINRRVVTEQISFNIGERIVSFRKRDLALIVGFNMGGEKPYISEDVIGDIWKRYFNGKKNVFRSDIKKAFEEINTKKSKKEHLDAVKLGLLHLIANYVIGNQQSIRCPPLYINLVDDIEAVNQYPWGDDLWDDLVDKVTKCTMILNTSTKDRFTFPGFLFALQIWAFETFPALAQAKICKVEENRHGLWPRALRWSALTKPSFKILADLIFQNKRFAWKEMVPTAGELQNELVAQLYGGSVDDSGSRDTDASFRVVKHQNEMSKDAIGSSGDGMDSEGSEKKINASNVINLKDNADKVGRSVGGKVIGGTTGQWKSIGKGKRKNGKGKRGDKEPEADKEETRQILKNIMAAVVLQSKRTQKVVDTVRKIRRAQIMQTEMLRQLLLRTSGAEQEHKQLTDMEGNKELQHTEQEKKTVTDFPSFELDLDISDDASEGDREGDVGEADDQFCMGEISGQNVSQQETIIHTQELDIHVERAVSHVLANLRQTMKETDKDKARHEDEMDPGNNEESDLATKNSVGKRKNAEECVGIADYEVIEKFEKHLRKM